MASLWTDLLILHGHLCDRGWFRRRAEPRAAAPRAPSAETAHDAE
ncbi:MAG TPA: hypothetical protein VF216_08490 [Mizugakiibacter sp.]